MTVLHNLDTNHKFGTFTLYFEMILRDVSVAHKTFSSLFIGTYFKRWETQTPGHHFFVQLCGSEGNLIVHVWKTNMKPFLHRPDTTELPSVLPEFYGDKQNLFQIFEALCRSHFFLRRSRFFKILKNAVGGLRAEMLSVLKWFFFLHNQKLISVGIYLMLALYASFKLCVALEHW